MKKIAAILWIFIGFSLQIVKSQNAPITTAGNIESTGTAVIVPITAANFTNVASCNLRLSYDQTIATAISVTKGPALPGNLAFNVTNPGMINLGWYHSANVTLPANTVIFNISFTKVTSGISPLSFVDNGNSCKFSDIYSVALIDVPTANYYINGSITFQSYAPQTIAPFITSSPGALVSIPIKVNDFNTIGAISLTMSYNAGILSYSSPASINPGFPGLSIDGDVPGTIIIAGIQQGSGVTFPDNTILLTLYFTYLGGSTQLNWIDNGTSCEYTGPIGIPVLNDSPRSSFYIDGFVGPESPVGDKTLNITLFLQGLYQGSGMMREASNESGSNFGDGIADKVTIELHDISNYNTILYTIPNLNLATNGVISATVPAILNGSYYVTILHRNSIPVVSASPLSFSGNVVTYNFTDLASKAYGNNMIQMSDGKWAVYAGDVNQDGTVDTGDMTSIDNDATNYVSGYMATDVNGDGIIDTGDMTIVDNNAGSYVSSITP